MLGLSASLVFLPTEKALADRPAMYLYGDSLSVSYDQCIDKAMNAASLVLSRLDKPANDGSIFALRGATAATITVIYCVEKPVGSVFIVNTSAYWSQNHSEALSVNNRIAQIILGQL